MMSVSLPLADNASKNHPIKSFLTIGSFSYLFPCCDKMYNESNLRKERVKLAHSLRVHSPSRWEDMVAERRELLIWQPPWGSKGSLTLWLFSFHFLFFFGPGL